MAKAVSRAPAQVIESIESKAKTVRVAAASLSEQIEEVEELLSKLPGRVEAVCFQAHPEANFNHGLELGLRFHRNGKTWTLSYGNYHLQFNEDPENPIEWKSLQDAPLKIKVAAVGMLPDLLVAIEGAQDRLVKELEQAAEEAAVFTESLKSRAKEAK